MGAAPCAGSEFALCDPVGAAEECGAEEALDEDDDPDDDLVVDGAADSEALLLRVGSAGELSALLVAGAVVGGVDGAEGVEGAVSWCDDEPVSSPSVVPDVCELVTSADTGFCEISSIPVMTPMATTKTATA